MLKGHGEYDASTQMTLFKTYLELENYELKDLDLLTVNTVPEDCKGLIVASPTKDFTDLEANAIKDYINRGGNIIWLSDPYSGKTETPYIQSILDMYGVNIRQDGIILEQDNSKYVMQNPDLIVPTIYNSDITNKITSVLLLDTGKLEFKENLSELNVTKTDLLASSSSSFFRTNLQNPSPAPASDEQVDVSVVAAMLEKTIGEDSNEEETKKSKFIVFANNLFVTDKPVYVGNSAVAAIGFYENKDLIINAVQNTAEITDTMTIRKTIKQTSYTATETQDRMIKVIIFSIPVVIIIIGIVVWQLRRRKR